MQCQVHMGNVVKRRTHGDFLFASLRPLAGVVRLVEEDSSSDMKRSKDALEREGKNSFAAAMEF